ncbi:MAG: hypothetical protein BWY71_01979 [Planctomycetes bacterium ADurb.Bin412]|nr:MAG: hypothetical protein BWY71_01979 [Planctomycetes bacterium ADurb.Bin412]
MVADGSQAVGEPVRAAIHFPGARPRPPFFGGPDIPAGVHPPVIQLQPFVQVAVDKLDLIFLVRLGHLRELVRAARHQHRQRRQLAARPRHIVLHHPLPPGILGIDPVAAFPELHHDHRGTDHLARQQLEMGGLLSGRYLQADGILPLEVGIPATGPAYHNDNSFVPGFQIIIGPFRPGGPAAGGPEFHLFTGFQYGAFGRIVVCRHKCPAPVVQAVFLSRLADEVRIQGLEIFYHRGIFAAGIGQIHRPFHGIEIGVFHAFPPHFQSRLWIGPGQSMGNPALLPFFVLGVELPALQ